MGRRGQIVNTSHSGGLGVSQTWARLFEQNEAAFRGRKHLSVLTDEELSGRMYAAFPDRRESEIFVQVQKVRNRYNRGVLPGQKGKRPLYLSRRYVRTGDHKVRPAF